jgi:hypothetical protein
MSKKIVVHVFFTTTNGNEDYRDFRLMFSAGKQDAGPGYVGTIASPVPVKNVSLPTDLPDPVFFSYPFSVVERGFVRGLLAKIRSVGGAIPSSCTFELLGVPEPASDEWKKLSAGDITLKYHNNPSNPVELADLLTNPQDIASTGEIIVGIDYDTRLLTILGNSELAGKSGDYVPVTPPHDMSGFLNDENDGDEETLKGRAIIALGSKLFPLFINFYEESEDEWVHGPGIITRVGVSGTALTDEVKAYVGLNPQEVCPGMDVEEGEVENANGNENGNENENEDEDENENVMNFIPCIGGEQLTDDGDTIATNGTDSMICVLPAKGSWPAVAPILLTGDPKAALVTAYDIHELGVIFRNRASLFFIMTVMYAGAAYDRLYYRIYLSTVGKMLDLRSLSSPPTLSEAVASGTLEVIDEGEIVSDPLDPAGLYHPSLSIIQHPTDPEKDLVVVCTGSAILVTRALAYGSPTAKNAPAPTEPATSTDPAPEPRYSRNNPYAMFGNNGGPSMNSLDLTIETLYQSMRGNVSLKHGLRMSRSIAAAKAATSAARLGTGAPTTPAAPAAEGEDEEK